MDFGALSCKMFGEVVVAMKLGGTLTNFSCVCLVRKGASTFASGIVPV